MKRVAHLLVVAGSCLAVLGCMSTQPLTVEPTQLSQTVHPKDRVAVVTKDGQTHKFKVETVDAVGLHGAGQTVAFNDIETISREKIDTGRTTLLAVGVAAAAAVAASAGGGGGGSGY